MFLILIMVMLAGADRGRKPTKLEACRNLCQMEFKGNCLPRSPKWTIKDGDSPDVKNEKMKSCKKSFAIATHTFRGHYTPCTVNRGGKCHKNVNADWKCDLRTLEDVKTLCGGKCYDWKNGQFEYPCPANAIARDTSQASGNNSAAQGASGTSGTSSKTVVINDFSSKSAMERLGWVFNWADRYVFAPGPRFCSGVPSTSYCGFRYPGAGKISYTFAGSGSATFVWGQSWKSGSVHVRKNNVEIASLTAPGTKTTTFSYAPNDVLEIEELGNSVINVHSLSLTKTPKAVVNALTAVASTGTPAPTPSPTPSPIVNRVPIAKYDCCDLKSQYNIVPHQTWGRLRDRKIKKWWDSNKCNNVNCAAAKIPVPPTIPSQTRGTGTPAPTPSPTTTTTEQPIVQRPAAAKIPVQTRGTPGPTPSPITKQSNAKVEFKIGKLGKKSKDACPSNYEPITSEAECEQMIRTTFFNSRASVKTWADPGAVCYLCLGCAPKKGVAFNSKLGRTGRMICKKAKNTPDAEELVALLEALLYGN